MAYFNSPQKVSDVSYHDSWNGSDVLHNYYVVNKYVIHFLKVSCGTYAILVVPFPF